ILPTAPPPKPLSLPNAPLNSEAGSAKKSKTFLPISPTAPVIPPSAYLSSEYPNFRATAPRIAVERPRFDLARGMYASPPVSGSAHNRIAPGRAICARWSSDPLANRIGFTVGSLRSKPTEPAILSHVPLMPFMYTVSITKFTDLAAASLIFPHALPITSPTFRNALPIASIALPKRVNTLVRIQFQADDAAVQIRRHAGCNTFLFDHCHARPRAVRARFRAA